jgi:putative transposase
MSLSDRKALIDRDDKDVSISNQCVLLRIHRSSLYYQAVTFSPDDIAIMHAIDRLHLDDPTLGTRRMKANLVKQGHNIGRDKVRNLMKIMRLKAVYCRPRTTISDPTKYKYPYLLRGLNITFPNHVWMIDISYIPMKQGFMYLVAIIDVYSRCIMGWDVSTTMEASWVCKCFQNAIQVYGCPQIINSDQGGNSPLRNILNLQKPMQIFKLAWMARAELLTMSLLNDFLGQLSTKKFTFVYLMMEGNSIRIARNSSSTII